MVKAYICSPLSAASKSGIRENMTRARKYMEQISHRYGYRTYAPHAYLPEILDDTCLEERALALSFGCEILKICQIVIVCGNRISSGMKREIELAFQLEKDVYLWQDSNCTELLPVREWRQIDEMQIQK